MWSGENRKELGKGEMGLQKTDKSRRTLNEGDQQQEHLGCVQDRMLVNVIALVFSLGL